MTQAQDGIEADGLLLAELFSSHFKSTEESQPFVCGTGPWYQQSEAHVSYGSNRGVMNTQTQFIRLIHFPSSHTFVVSFRV